MQSCNELWVNKRALFQVGRSRTVVRFLCFPYWAGRNIPSCVKLPVVEFYYFPLQLGVYFDAAKKKNIQDTEDIIVKESFFFPLF